MDYSSWGVALLGPFPKHIRPTEREVRSYGKFDGFNLEFMDSRSGESSPVDPRLSKLLTDVELDDYRKQLKRDPYALVKIDRGVLRKDMRKRNLVLKDITLN